MERLLGSVRSIVLIAILGFLLFFGAAGWLGQQFLADNARTQERVDHTSRVIATIATARIQLSRAQLYSRSFVVTGSPQEASVAEDAARVATDTLLDLRSMVADNPAQVRRFDDAATTTEQILVTNDRIIAAVRRGDVDGARDIVRSAADQGPAFRATIEEAAATERTLLAERRAATAATLQRIIWLLAGISALAAACGLLAVWAMSRQVRTDQRRYRELERAKRESDDAARALAESQAQMQAVLDSARDPILVVDRHGVVELANRACGEAFGASSRSLVGTDISELVPALIGGAHPAGEVQVTRRDGSGFPAEISTGVFERDGREMSVCILRDRTERHRLDQLKNEFVSTVSHELRTPLTSIRGSLGLIVAGAAGPLPDKAKALLEIAHKNSERLVGLVNDILDIEKIESGRMEFRHDRLEAGSLVEQAVEANQAYAAQHEVEYRITARSDETLPVLGDADRLIQVLTNLLSNAAKFSPAGTAVEVAVETAGSQVQVSVRDRGAGIPEAFRNRIFQRFAQADASDIRRKGGTGLGLSIAKAIVERHGGRIGFEPAEGGGTRFWFTLPLLAEAQETPTTAGDARRRVLVCEDDPDVAMLLGLMIEQDGWRVDIARDAETALEKARTGQYDAMTVDLLLPGMDGITLIRQLRADAATAALPIVVVSATAQDGKRELNGDAVNIVDWLDKPIEQLRLRAALRQAGLRSRSGRARILHVEDDDDVIEVVSAIVRDEAEIIPARSLREGRQKLAEQRFDLVIIDVGLPDGSGLDLLETINARTPREPVLIFSAQDSSAAYASAVSASLVKSRTDNRQLHQTITALINGLIQDKHEDPHHGR
ncbi:MULTISPECIES: response regulator [Inquilinus]|uniref:histidine kinase n=1 Tax=Inquilinus ginsengisoli TaxID=363840 RepID=A0ABU1JYP2_9PROT|nr:response regulator [Inquilinus ginsengisoli]MDR6293751.1 PAS domain S-box-containing protein [Inquilinus ginsengisoli]